jgi:hypothetical protein
MGSNHHGLAVARSEIKPGFKTVGSNIMESKDGSQPLMQIKMEYEVSLYSVGKLGGGVSWRA